MARRRDYMEDGGMMESTDTGRYAMDADGGVYDAPYQAPPYQAPAPPPAPEPTPAPQYTSYGSNPLEGFDYNKIASGHDSPKYQVGRVMSNFDPSQGITPELLDALNALGIGDFSGSRDRISVANADPRFEGVTEFDVVRNFTGGGSKAWNWQGVGGDNFVPDVEMMRSPVPQVSAPAAPINLGGGGSGSGSGFATSRPMFGEEVMENLRKLFPDGLYNQELVQRRSEGAAEDLRRFNKGRMANNRAMLAERGLIGSGPEQTEAFNRESDIADRYSQAVSGIYANEMENADSRMMQALQTAAGMSMEEARNLIDQFRAQTDRDVGMGNIALGDARRRDDFTLGQGNLALGNYRAQNDYNLGQGQLGLGYDQLNFQNEQADWDQWMDLIENYMNGAQGSARGYV